MSANSCVQIKIEEDYDQVLIEDDASDLTGNSSAASSHIQKRQQRDNGKQPSSCPTQTPKRCFPGEQRVNYSFHNTKGQGSVSLACNMGKTTQDSSLSKDSFGTDHLITLGEILSYCQVMYGAIQKLDEKFEQLQAKVTNVHIIQMTPDVFPLQNLASKTPSLSTSKVPSAVSVNTSSVADPVLSMPQLVRVCSPPPPASVEVKRPPALSPVPRFPSPPSLAPQVWLGNRKRNVCISQSALHKANLMSKPGRAVRFLMRCVFSMEEMSCSNTLGDVTRGLKKLDPNKLSAIREWLAKRYPGYDLKEKGKDWRKCMSIMNSTARYLRLMAKRRGLKMQEKSEDMAKPLGLTESHIKPIPEAEADTEPVAEQPMDNYVAEMEDPTELGEPIEEHTAEIDVELSESEEEDDASLSTQIGNEEENSPISCSDIAYEYLGNPERDVKVPQYAMFTALQRTRPELAARVLIKYMFPEEVLVVSNVHGNVESGIRALDYNKISALREHLQERFPWLLLEEDGQDWKVCVGAINSTIRKFRHDLKMGRGRKKGI